MLVDQANATLVLVGVTASCPGVSCLATRDPDGNWMAACTEPAVNAGRGEPRGAAILHLLACVLNAVPHSIRRAAGMRIRMWGGSAQSSTHQCGPMLPPCHADKLPWSSPPASLGLVRGALRYAVKACGTLSSVPPLLSRDGRPSAAQNTVSPAKPGASACAVTNLSMHHPTKCSTPPMHFESLPCCPWIQTGVLALLVLATCPSRVAGCRVFA